MIDENLDESNFLEYAAKHYTNSNCFTTDEFLLDVKKFRYLKKLFERFHESKELKPRLILNHIITIYNIFDNKAATRMLFFKLEEYPTYLKPFLEFLNRMPSAINKVNGKIFFSKDIIPDSLIQQALKEI